MSTRKAAAKALDDLYDASTQAGVLGPQTDLAVPALGDALADADRDVRYYAAKSLSKVGEGTAAAAVEGLAAALTDADEGVQRYAAKALGEIGPEAAPAVPALVDAVARLQTIAKKTDNQASMYYFVMKTLKKVDQAAKPAEAYLREALKDKNANIRRDAESALRHIAEAEASPTKR